MYAAYIVPHDINTVAYKSGILYIKNTMWNIIKINNNGPLGRCGCNVMTCILRIPNRDVSIKNTAQSLRVEKGEGEVSRLSLLHSSLRSHASHQYCPRKIKLATSNTITMPSVRIKKVQCISHGPLRSGHHCLCFCQITLCWQRRSKIQFKSDNIASLARLAWPWRWIQSTEVNVNPG